MCYWPYNHLQQQAFHIPMKNQQDKKKKISTTDVRDQPQAWVLQ